MKILIIGGGYVGLATANLLKNNQVCIYDTGKINYSLLTDELNLKFEVVDNLEDNFDLVFICVPTVGTQNSNLDTSIVEYYINFFKKRSNVIVRSTVPIGFCDEHNVDYMPEFLTEKDPFKTSRMVYGVGCGDKPKINLKGLICTTTEAEMIKLFSNAYLSMRLAYFYEVKRLAEESGVDFNKVKTGICSDIRIGTSYSDLPYLIGGKCLPKDIDAVSHCSLIFNAVKSIKDNQTKQ